MMELEDADLFSEEENKPDADVEMVKEKDRLSSHVLFSKEY